MSVLLRSEEEFMLGFYDVKTGAREVSHITQVRWTPFFRPKWGLAKLEPTELNTSWS